MQRWQKQNPEPETGNRNWKSGQKGAAEKPDFAFEAAATKATKTC